MGNRLRTTYYTRKVCTTIPGTDNLQEYNMVSYITLGNKRYVRYSHEDWYLDMVMNAEGYTKFDYGDEFYPFYYIKDHLGNIRETYVRTSTNSKYIAQRMQYYPSGLPWETNLGVSEQPFKYGSKEFVEMHGLDEYDSEARWYYPAIMRTTTMDPMCEKYYSTSPYAWCSNNPVNYIDPDGRDWYKNSDSTAVLWRNSHEETIDINSVSYQNIGDKYSYTIGNDTYTYHQNELYSISTNVMSEDDFISQFSKEDWGGTPAKYACQKACDAMLFSAGYESAAPSNDFVIVENINGIGSAGAANGNAVRAIREMTDNLYAGFPSKVSVDHRPGTGGHADKIGDHFVVIRGVTEYLSNGKVIGTEYRFFDPGTQWPIKGTAGTLRLQDWKLVGVAPYGIHRPYIVSSIRLCK